jgi:hypothetical protein
MRQQGGATPLNVFERTVPFQFERHYFGERRKAEVAYEVETVDGDKPDEDYTSLTKRLIKSPTIAAIKTVDLHFGYDLAAAASPWRPGLWLVPVAMVERVNDRAEKWDIDRAEAVDKAVQAYPLIVETMKEKLTTLFDPKDYPTADGFKSAYWTAWRFVDMGAPTLLKTIKAEVFARERRKVEAEGAKAAALIQQHLRGTLLKITEHVADLLAVKPDGKHKKLRDGSLDNLLKYLDTIALRDVTQDGDLQRVVNTLKGLGRGLSVEALKTDDLLRDATAAAFSKAASSLDALVVERVRGVRFREEELV